MDAARSSKKKAYLRRGETLSLNCTAKGSHEGTGGKTARFIASIAYGTGFILSEQYQGNMNGEEFAKFIRTHFKSAFERSANPKGKLFLQDGDPSQNSRKAQNAMYAVDAKKFSIPPRSPDANPIENVFNQVKRQLRQEALHQKIGKESF